MMLLGQIYGTLSFNIPFANCENIEKEIEKSSPILKCNKGTLSTGWAYAIGRSFVFFPIKVIETNDEYVFWIYTEKLFDQGSEFPMIWNIDPYYDDINNLTSRGCINVIQYGHGEINTKTQLILIINYLISKDNNKIKGKPIVIKLQNLLTLLKKVYV